MSDFFLAAPPCSDRDFAGQLFALFIWSISGNE